MKRIAIPIAGERLSTHFGSCAYYRIFVIEGLGITSHKLDVPAFDDIMSLPLWVADRQITDIIAYKIDKTIIDLFAKHKINVWVGAPDLDPDDLIKEYLNGTLTSNEKVLFNDNNE